jgi:putative hydrolase of the HAD superfamily
MIDAGVRAVFFDAVGTLLFPYPSVARTYAEAARRHGSQVTEEKVREGFRTAFARQEEIDRRAGWRTDEARERARWQTIVSEVLPAACFDELWLWFSTPQAWRVNPDAVEVIARLTARGLTLGVASNFDARLEALLGELPELAPLRGRCVISSRVGWRKPAADFFAELTRVAGHPAESVVHVGDDLQNDVEGATAAGLRAILFDPKGQTSSVPRIRQLRDLLLG